MILHWPDAQQTSRSVSEDIIKLVDKIAEIAFGGKLADLNLPKAKLLDFLLEYFKPKSRQAPISLKTFLITKGSELRQSYYEYYHFSDSKNNSGLYWAKQLFPESLDALPINTLSLQHIALYKNDTKIALSEIKRTAYITNEMINYPMKHGNFRVINALLEKYPRLEIITDNLFAAIYKCKSDDAELLKFLQNSSERPNISAEIQAVLVGMQLLEAKIKQSKLLQILAKLPYLIADFDINAVDVFGKSILDYAAEQNNLKLTWQILLPEKQRQYYQHGNLKKLEFVPELNAEATKQARINKAWQLLLPDLAKSERSMSAIKAALAHNNIAIAALLFSDKIIRANSSAKRNELLEAFNEAMPSVPAVLAKDLRPIKSLHEHLNGKVLVAQAFVLGKKSIDPTALVDIVFDYL